LFKDLGVNTKLFRMRIRLAEKSSMMGRDYNGDLGINARIILEQS
jgi:hypothetical protein